MTIELLLYYHTIACGLPRMSFPCIFFSMLTLQMEDYKLNSTFRTCDMAQTSLLGHMDRAALDNNIVCYCAGKCIQVIKYY